MKCARRILLAVAALAMLASIGVFAGNQYETFVFHSNAEKRDSDLNYKADDGDMLAYVTPLSSYGGDYSSVFESGGTFYARSRWAGNTNVCSGLFTLRSYGAYTESYGSDVEFGSNYLLRAETDDIDYDYQVDHYMVVRWCP